MYYYLSEVQRSFAASLPSKLCIISKVNELQAWRAPVELQTGPQQLHCASTKGEKALLRVCDAISYLAALAFANKL